MAKRLNIKKTTPKELVANGWFIETIPFIWRFTPIYIRCNAKGKVNWDVAPVYPYTELIERDNVKVIK